MAGVVVELSKTWLLEGEFGSPQMCGFEILNCALTCQKCTYAGVLKA